MALSSGMEWLSSLGAAWLPVLADAAVKGTVILIVASIVSLFVRRASAATRHLVWFLALVGLLGLPALSVALPGWQVLPDWFAVGRTAALDTREAAMASAADEPAVPPAADGPPWSAGGGVPEPAGQPAAGAAAAAHGPRPLGAASGTPPAPEAGASRSWSAINLWIWILPLWAAGAALSLAPVAIGLVSLRRLRRTSRWVSDGPWAALLERLSAELGLKRRVVLLRSARRSMPMAWGLVRPKLLIPEEAEGWSPECLRAVLLHELAHIKRWDCLTQLVARVTCGMYWFNPLAWLALHRMVAEHERACDDVVLAAGGRAPEYAEHLLEVASRLPAVRFSLGVGIALARPSRLEGRLLAILDGKRSRRAVTRAAVLGSILALAAVLVPLAVMRPTVQAEQAAVVAAAGSSSAAAAVAWSEALNGLRARLTAPSGTVYRRRAALPLLVEVQNVDDKPIPFSRFSPQVRILATDAKGAWMGIPQRSPELSPWEGRTDSLSPGNIVRLTVWFDRLRFVKPVEQGSSLDLKVSAPTQLVEPGKLPKEVYSPPVTIQIKDEFPSLPSETDLTGEWTAAMDLTFWEGMGLRGHRAMHIDGQGRVTMLSRMGRNDDGLMPPGRTEAVLGKERLGRLAKLLRDQQVWNLAELKPDIGPDDAGEIRLSLANGGTSLVGDYPWHVAKDQPSLMALRTEMHALVADAVAAARKQSEGSGERPGKAEAGPRTGKLTPEQEKERDRLLTEADQRLRKGLIALGEEFPRLKAVHHWNLLADKSSVGSVIVGLSTVTDLSKTTGGVDVAEGERFSLSVNVVPADRADKQQLRVGILYRNLGLFGIAGARADDPKLDADLKKLLDDSLAPLMALDEQVGKGRPAVPVAEAEPLPGSGTPLEKALAEGYAFVALCEAADEAALEDKVTGVHEYATCYQTLTVVEVLAGQKPADGVKGFHYTPFLWRGEHAVNKGQRVVWIVRQVEERFRGIKALEDTPENRKAIAEATGVAIKPPVPPAADAAEAKPAAAGVAPKTFAEILATEVPADQESLLKLAQSDKGEKGFYALLKLRQVGDAKAVQVLAQILADNFGSTRIHGFAAAQALFCIGTPEAHQVLARYLFTRDYQVPWGIKYAFSWEMEPVQRDAFIERYHLRSTGKELAVSLQAKPWEKDPQAETELTITLKNQTDKPLRVYDPDVYLGRTLLLRSANGQFINSLETVRYNRRLRQGDEAYPLLGPGQERSYRIKASVRQDVPEAWNRLLPEGNGLALDCGDVWHFIGQPGKFKAYAWNFLVGQPGKLKAYAVFYSAPLTKEQAELNKLKPEEVWSGYVVSAPVEIEIPATAEAAGGTSSLRGGSTTDAGLKTYARLKNREGVEVESISGSKITDVGLKELADFRNLRALNLMCARGVTDAGMKELKGCMGLRELHLVNTGVSNAGLAELKGLDALEVLFLAGPKITDAGLNVLRDFKGLREVCLLGITFTDAGLKELKNLKDLRALHLRSPGITDAGLRELRGFTSLQVLSLTDTNITDAGLKELKGLSALRELNLRYTKVTDAGMRDVAEFKALQVLDLTYTNVTDAGLKELEGLKGLRELRCVGAAVTAAGVERLRKALPNAEITSGEGAGARPTLDPPSAPDAAASPAVGDTGAAAGLANGRLVEIRGRVLDPAGKPVPGAKVFVAGRGHVVFDAEVKPPLPTTETDAEGRFRLPAPAEGAKGIAVSTPALRAWSVAIDGTGEEIALRLPEAGTLVLRYRMEGDDPEAVFCVHLETWEMPAWKGVAALRLKANAPNKGEVILANLPPGTYDLWREKSLAAGDRGIGVFCDRREATIAAGKTTVVEFTRGKGFRITGRIAGLPEGAVPGVFVTVKAADAEANGPDYMVPRRDAVVCPPNGQFTTAPVPPGQYVLEASAYKPEPRTGVWDSRWRGPDFVGSARVTVPEDGPPESVRIEMGGAGLASAAPLAPADEVLKQLTTIVELEERILAGVQERFKTGRASAEDVGRQQLKVTDAKVRLAERKAELIAQGKGPRGAGDEAPGTSTQAAIQDQIRRLLEEAVAQEEKLLAQMRQRYDVGKATSEEVDRQQVRVTEAKVRLAERVKATAAQAEKPAGAAGKTSAAPAEAWGELVEGVQCRLRANRTQWPLGLAPILKADVRNTGKRSFTVAQSEQLWDLEVDGRWYQWTGSIRVKSSLLDPGREYREIAFTLADPWHRKDGGDPLALKPGRHTVRIAALCTPDQDGAAMVRTMSNAVEIEVLPGEAKPAATSAPVPVPVSTVPEKTPPAAGDARTRADQRVFPLKYHEADASEAVVSGNTFQRSLPEKPAEVKTVPAGLLGEAVYFSLTVGPRKVLALLEVASPPRLFVDVAGTGDLAAVQPLAARPWGPLQQFGPVDIPVNGKARPAVRVRFLCAADKYLAASKDLAVAPAGYMAGEVNLDGQPYRVALVDHSLSGRYDNVLRGEGDSDSARGETYLAVDLNQDGRLEPPGARPSETFTLLPALHVMNAYYSVQVAPDGSSIALAKAEPDFGTLDTGCAELSLALVGEHGLLRVSGSGGKWQVPAGWHAATGATLSRSDEAGTLWSLHGVSSWGRLARFDVRSGQVLSLRAGSPLSVKVHPGGLQPNGMIHFALALVGQAGESYNAAPKRGDVPQPPRFRVLDEAGRVLGSGVFNAGSERTYSWCWWRVPEGFKGKYRVEVEGDWGPFEVLKGKPEWFSIE